MDVPFDVLMKQAIDLKSAQLAENRRLYDSWKPWYRNSLFSREDVIAIRKVDDFNAKLAFVNDCRACGNDFFRAENYISAIVEYDRALSVWDWVESVLSDWKRQAIEDKDLRQLSFEAGSVEEEKAVRESKVTILLNLALCYSKNLQYSDAIAACDEVLEKLDPNNVKALYRRAMARVTPKNSGTTEHLLALRDLKRAVELCNATNNTKDSNYTAILRSYEKLQRDIFLMRQSERKHFLHLFDKIEQRQRDATINQDDDNDENDEKKEVNNNRNNNKDGDDVSEALWHPILHASDVELEKLSQQLSDHIETLHLRLQGNEEEEACHIKELEERLRAIERLLSVRRQQRTVRDKTDVDFLHPTDEMIEEAKQFDLDLTNARQRELLHEMKTMDADKDLKDSGMSERMARAVRRVYEKEAKDLAHIAMKDCDRHSMIDMLLTRQSNQRHLPITNSDKGRRFTFTTEEVAGWSNEVVASRLEEELVTDFVLTYERFQSPTRKDKEENDERVRQEWSDAVVKTMLLYHEPLSPTNKSLSRSIWEMMQRIVRHCQQLLFPTTEKKEGKDEKKTKTFLASLTSSSILQTMIMIFIMLLCRLLARHFLFPLLFPTQ